MDSNAEKTPIDMSSEEPGAVSSAVPSDSDTTTSNDTGNEVGMNSATTSISFVAISKIANTNNLKYNSEEAENFPGGKFAQQLLELAARPALQGVAHDVHTEQEQGQ